MKKYLIIATTGITLLVLSVIIIILLFNKETKVTSTTNSTSTTLPSISTTIIYDEKETTTNNIETTSKTSLTTTKDTTTSETSVITKTTSTSSSTTPKSNSTTKSTTTNSTTTTKSITTKKDTTTTKITTTETTTTTTTITSLDKNNEGRKELENKYKIKIKYKDELQDYNCYAGHPVGLSSENEITSALKELKTELAKYPTSFFTDFKGSTLTIYLAESVPGNKFVGLTDHTFGDNVIMTLIYNYEFPYTFHHETMHFIDFYIQLKKWDENIYEDYLQYNPEGYTYGNPITKYNYGQNNYVDNYFFSNYAQSNVREDRAEVYKQMMGRAYAPYKMFNEGLPLRNKADSIANQIISFFPSYKNYTPYWTKIVK